MLDPREPLAAVVIHPHEVMTVLTEHGFVLPMGRTTACRARRQAFSHLALIEAAARIILGERLEEYGRQPPRAQVQAFGPP